MSTRVLRIKATQERPEIRRRGEIEIFEKERRLDPSRRWKRAIVFLCAQQVEEPMAMPVQPVVGQLGKPAVKEWHVVLAGHPRLEYGRSTCASAADGETRLYPGPDLNLGG